MDCGETDELIVFELGHTWDEGVRICGGKLATKLNKNMLACMKFVGLYYCDQCLPLCRKPSGTTTTTTTVSTNTIPTPMTTFRTACPECGTFKNGEISCCAPGGSWFNNCGKADESLFSDFEHTWGEGVQICESKLATDLNKNMLNYMKFVGLYYWNQCLPSRRQT